MLYNFPRLEEVLNLAVWMCVLQKKKNKHLSLVRCSLTEQTFRQFSSLSHHLYTFPCSTASISTPLALTVRLLDFR